MCVRSRLILVVAALSLLFAPAGTQGATFGDQSSTAVGANLSIVGSDATSDLLLAAATPGPAQPSSRIYTVQRGDTLGGIALRFDVTTDALIQANDLRDPDDLTAGQRLVIPGVGRLQAVVSPGLATTGRPSLLTRLPARARNAAADSPLQGTTWLTYYGRPGVPIMGILGEYSLDDLVPQLRLQARAYDDANGPDLSVTPALHLIYGMATTREGPKNDHLVYLENDLVRQYIDRAAWEGMGVILDVQIGAVTPLESIKPAFPYLKYRNVQLALDPEFAMTTPGQTVPGQPPGALTAAQINAVQSAMVTYMQDQRLPYHKLLIVHQFLPTMIIGKDDINELPGIDILICVDGYGPPGPKISKYNAFMAENVQFAGFKVFYRWDEPLMSASQVLGTEAYPNAGYMEVTPSLIVYQ